MSTKHFGGLNHIRESLSLKVMKPMRLWGPIKALVKYPQPKSCSYVFKKNHDSSWFSFLKISPMVFRASCLARKVLISFFIGMGINGDSKQQPFVEIVSNSSLKKVVTSLP